MSHVGAQRYSSTSHEHGSHTSISSFSADVHFEYKCCYLAGYQRKRQTEGCEGGEYKCDKCILPTQVPTLRLSDACMYCIGKM